MEGAGTQLHSVTLSQSKQLLPLCDMPMICDPISTLMAEVIRGFANITTPRRQSNVGQEYAALVDKY